MTDEPDVLDKNARSSDSGARPSDSGARPSASGVGGSDNDAGSKAAPRSSKARSLSSKATSRPATVALLALALAAAASAAFFAFDGTVREGPPIPDSYPYTCDLYKVGSPSALQLTKWGLLALTPCACVAGLVARARPSAVAASSLTALANTLSLTGTFFSAVSLNKAWGGTGLRFVVPALFALALAAAIIDLRDKITYVRTRVSRATTVQTRTNPVKTVQRRAAQTQTDTAATASGQRSSGQTETQALANGARSTAERKTGPPKASRFWRADAAPAIVELLALTLATGFAITHLVLDDVVSGGVLIMALDPPECSVSYVADYFVIVMTGWALLALIPSAYAAAIAALARRTAVAASITSVIVNALALACTLPSATFVFSQEAFPIAFTVPLFFAIALIGARADLRKKIKAV